MYFVCFLSFAFVFLVGAAAGEQSHVCWRRPHSQLHSGKKDDHDQQGDEDDHDKEGDED